MRKYETMFIVDPDMGSEEIEKECNMVVELIKNHGGEILETDNWGRKRLAYEIGRKREGHYYVLTFNWEPNHITELERHFNLNENILRHIVLDRNE